MAQRSKVGFKSTKNSRYANNTTGDISAADGSDCLEDVADSFLNIPDDIHKKYTATASGTDTYTATLDPSISAYGSTDVYFILFTNANTGAATLNLNSLGAKAISKNGATALAAGDISAGQIYALAYDGTNLQILGRFGVGISGLTTNRIPYATSSTTIADDTDLTWDPSTQNLGVGVTNALAKVHVHEDSLGAQVFRLSSPATNDDPAVEWYQSRQDTIGNTPINIHTVTIPAITSILMVGFVVARRTGGVSGTAEDGAAYRIEAVFKNVAGTATLIGGGVTVIGESQAGWDVSLVPSTNTVGIQITGAASNDITWHLSDLRVMRVST